MWHALVVVSIKKADLVKNQDIDSRKKTHEVANKANSKASQGDIDKAYIAMKSDVEDKWITYGTFLTMEEAEKAVKEKPRT